IDGGSSCKIDNREKSSMKRTTLSGLPLSEASLGRQIQLRFSPAVKRLVTPRSSALPWPVTHRSLRCHLVQATYTLTTWSSRAEHLVCIFHECRPRRRTRSASSTSRSFTRDRIPTSVVQLPSHT